MIGVDAKGAIELGCQEDLVGSLETTESSPYDYGLRVDSYLSRGYDPVVLFMQLSEGEHPVVVMVAIVLPIQVGCDALQAAQAVF